MYDYLYNYYSMEGGEIIDYILKRENLTEGVVVSYLKQLLNALDYIHEKKVIHCDIKVSISFSVNVFIR